VGTPCCGEERITVEAGEDGGKRSGLNGKGKGRIDGRG
jgi:hypothetical protein